MEPKIIVYFVAEDGFMKRAYIQRFLEMFKKNGYVIEDVGTGNAYNMPIYLLGEVEEHIEKAVVVSVSEEDENVKPMVFFSDGEIQALVKRLKTAVEGEDSFNIIKKVHKEMRNR